MLRIVTFKWEPQGDYRTKFTGQHVNKLARMVRKHYSDPHEFVCVTDNKDGINPEFVRCVPLWSDYAHLPAPQGRQNPSCYRRLRMFSPGMSEIIGPRFVMLDLDVLILDDMRPVWNRPEDFVIWGGTNSTTPYNGSMMLMNAGARSEVWRDFEPIVSIPAAIKAGYWGSDQGWISHKLGPGEAMWSQEDGVYSYRNDFQIVNRKDKPDNARIIIFHGHIDPWDSHMHKTDWITEAYKAA